MAGRVTSWLSRPGLFWMMLSRLRLAARLMRERRVPLLTKSLPLLAALYLISPVDFVPDVFPVLGQLDDVGIILLALDVFIRLSPAGAVEFHRSAIARNHRYSPMSPTDDFIDAEWRRDR